MFRHLALALQFYTKIPLPSIKKCELKDFAYSLAWGPVAGGVIAVILKLVLGLFLWLELNSFSAAVGMLLAYLLLTGGIHFDGIADTFDGAGSGLKGERLLKVLKDPTIGSLGGVFLILAVIQYLYYFYIVIPFDPPFYAWAWPFVISRSTPVFLSATLPYLKSEDQGYRNSFVELVSWQQVIIALIIILSFQTLFMPATVHFFLLNLFFSVLAFSWLFFKFKFKAVNGDMLGASILFMEMAYFHWMLETQLV